MYCRGKTGTAPPAPRGVELRIREAQRMPGELIRVGDNPGPLRRTLAGATNKVVAVVIGVGKEPDVNKNRRIWISVVRYMGNAARLASVCCTDADSRFWCAGSENCWLTPPPPPIQPISNW